MLPLAGPSIPDSTPAFADALKAGLAAHGAPPREVAAEGAWPALDALKVDLTGAQISRSPQLAKEGAATVGQFTAATFAFVAAPAFVESAPVHASLRAANAEFAITQQSDAEMTLTLKRATDGDLAVEISLADLERVLHSFASEAAGKHGVEIKKTTVTATARGPQAVSLAAEVTAKMFIATAVIKISGDMDLDEHLVARLSNLQFHGEGMVANLAGAVIRPQLARLEGRTFSLADFAPGDLSLREVTFSAGDPLRLSARFGS